MKFLFFLPFLISTLLLMFVSSCSGSNSDEDDSSDDSEPDCTINDYCVHNQTCEDPGAEVPECVNLTEKGIADRCPENYNALLSCNCSCLNLSCVDPSGGDSWGDYGECISACGYKWCPPVTEP
jgi:hypothetical protein